MSVDTADVTDRLRRMSPQRWWFAFAAVATAAFVPIVTGIAGSGQSPIVLALVVGLAGASVTQPDSYVALTVPVVALWHWTASVDASTTGWVLVVALCLFSFHTLVALMATTPARATVDHRSCARWLRRGVLVTLATGAMWSVVAAVDQQRLAGSAIMTAAAFVAAAVLMVAVISNRRSAPPTS